MRSFCPFNLISRDFVLYGNVLIFKNPTCPLNSTLNLKAIHIHISSYIFKKFNWSLCYLIRRCLSSRQCLKVLNKLCFSLFTSSAMKSTVDLCVRTTWILWKHKLSLRPGSESLGWSTGIFLYRHKRSFFYLYTSRF